MADQSSVIGERVRPAGGIRPADLSTGATQFGVKSILVADRTTANSH
jgi:hypothetical protein